MVIKIKDKFQLLKHKSIKKVLNTKYLKYYHNYFICLSNNLLTLSIYNFHPKKKNLNLKSSFLKT